MNYLNKSKLKRITALALAAVMSAQIFTGCSDTATSSDSTSGAVSNTQSETSSDGVSDTSSDTGEEEENNVIEAQSVEFNESGEYSTTLTSAEIDLSDVKAEDVTVSYDIVDVDGYINAQAQAEEDYEKALDELAASAVESEDDLSDMTLPELEMIDIEKYVSSKNVEVKSVSAEKDKLELSFKDPDAAAELTGFYTISLNGKKYNDEDVTVDLSVNFKDFVLTPNIESVLSNAEETRLTLELNDGSFADNVTKDDITLSGSFEDMKIDSLSCSGKNLTMQLVGKPTKLDGLTTYVDGIVSVRPQAIKEAGCEVRACIPIELIANSFDASTLKADGDKVTAQLELIGTAKPLDELKAEDIKFENDVTVTDVKKVDDTHVELTMTVNGATDANSAADILNDQKLTIADDELTVSAAKAHFYPVFDAIEQEGDDLKLTIIAYVENGSFSDDIKAEQVALGEDFESGKVVSAEKQNDTTAQIVLTVPANGQTAEEFSFDGSITLKAGAMNSAWGDASDEDYTYSRNFSMESLGRAPFMFPDIFPFGGVAYINNMVQDINTIFNNYLIALSNAGVQNPQNLVIPMRAQLERAIETSGVYTADTRLTIQSQTSALANLKTIARAQVAGMAMNAVGLGMMAFSFCSDLGLVGANKDMIDVTKQTEQRVAQLKETVENEYHRLCGLKAAALKSIVTEFEVRLGDLQQYIDICRAYFTEKCCDDLGVEMPEKLLPDATASQFCYDVSVALTDACRNKDAGYESYQKDFNMLMKRFDLVCNQLLLGDGGDPLTALDQAYANIDNFSTTSYMLKKAYRTSVMKTLEEAMNLIRWYKLASYKLETDADGQLIIHKGATEGEDYYSFDMDTIDLTDEDLFEDACERLLDMPIYDDGTIAEYREENNLSFEQQMRNSDYFKMYYDHLTANHCQYALLLATRYYCQRYNITQEKMDEDYNIKLEDKDISKYQSDIFSEKEGLTQMADMVSYPISATYSTVQDNEPGGHWATDDYGPINTYIQESGSEIRHEVKADRPYCYSLNTYISMVDNCYLSDSQFRAYTNYTDLQVTEFFNRLEDSGRTLLEELTNAGITISEEYANQAKERGNGGDNADPNNLYGIALTHSSGKTGGLIKKSWNTYANLCYWDAKKKDDICQNRSMVWHGRNNTAVNKIAVLIP